MTINSVSFDTTSTAAWTALSLHTEVSDCAKFSGVHDTDSNESLDGSPSSLRMKGTRGNLDLR